MLDMKLLSEDEARRLLDPMLMTDPKAMARAIAEFRASRDVKPAAV